MNASGGLEWSLPNRWRVIKIGVDLAADIGGGSFTNTYAIPDDGRDIMELTLADLRAYPAASAMALLAEVLSSHPHIGDRHG